MLLPLIGYHERRNGDPRLSPTMLPGNVDSQPYLDIQDPKRCLDVAHRGLDLDDKDDARRRVEREEVVAAPLSVMVEADLDGDQPSKRAKHRGDGVLQISVSGVDQAVELLSLPGEVGIQACAKRIGDTVQRAEGHAFPSAVLDQADDASRYTGNGREVRLGEPQPMAQDSESVAHGTPHGPMMTSGAYRAITGRLPPSSMTSALEMRRMSSGPALGVTDVPLSARMGTGRGFCGHPDSLGLPAMPP